MKNSNCFLRTIIREHDKENLLHVMCLLYKSNFADVLHFKPKNNANLLHVY